MIEAGQFDKTDGDQTTLNWCQIETSRRSDPIYWGHIRENLSDSYTGRVDARQMAFKAVFRRFDVFYRIST